MNHGYSNHYGRYRLDRKGAFQIPGIPRNAGDHSYPVIPKEHSSTSPGITYAAWNIEKQTINEEAIKNSKYIIHLAGAGVADKPWTEKRKKEIVESRTKSSELLVKALSSIPNQIVSVVSASAIGWYGENPSGQSDRNRSSGSRFSG